MRKRGSRFSRDYGDDDLKSREREDEGLKWLLGCRAICGVALGSEIAF